MLFLSVGGIRWTLIPISPETFVELLKLQGLRQGRALAGYGSR